MDNLKLAKELLAIAKKITAAKLVKNYSVVSNNHAVIRVYTKSHGITIDDVVVNSNSVKQEMKSIIDLLDMKKLIDKESLPDVFVLSDNNQVRVNMTYHLHFISVNEDMQDVIFKTLEEKGFQKVTDE